MRLGRIGEYATRLVSRRSPFFWSNSLNWRNYQQPEAECLGRPDSASERLVKSRRIGHAENALIFHGTVQTRHSLLLEVLAAPRIRPCGLHIDGKSPLFPLADDPCQHLFACA